MPSACQFSIPLANIDLGRLIAQRIPCSVFTLHPRTFNAEVFPDVFATGILSIQHTVVSEAVFRPAGELLQFFEFLKCADSSMEK